MPSTSVGRAMAAFFASVALTLAHGSAHALGTGFTYQGLLQQSGVPLNGTCDFQFSLWDAEGTGTPPTGGAQLGTQSFAAPPVSVSRGVFTVRLNGAGEFGPNAFAGPDRWLQVAVRCPAGSGAFTTLSPRQLVTAAPYALYSANTPWSGVTGKPAGFNDGIDNDALGGLSCAPGQVAKWTGANWTCQGDDNTTYSGGSGLLTNGTQFSVDTNAIQSRVNATCSTGSAIRGVGANGTPTCETFPTYGAGAGLSLAGGQFSVDGTVQRRSVTPSCAAGSVLRSVGSDGTPTCAPASRVSYAEFVSQVGPEPDGHILRFQFTVPGPGTVLVHANYMMAIRNNGVFCSMSTQLSSTASNTFGFFDSGVSYIAYPESINTFGPTTTAYLTVPGASQRAFSVGAAGPATVYLNGKSTCGDGHWRNIQMSATYFETQDATAILVK